MSTAQSTVDFLTDQMQPAGSIRSRKMFGEYAIYCDEKVVALVCDDQLYVKITDAGRIFFDTPQEAPPYRGAKNHFLVPEDKWDDAEWLTTFIAQTVSSLPLPKPKKTKTQTLAPSGIQAAPGGRASRPPVLHPMGQPAASPQLAHPSQETVR